MLMKIALYTGSKKLLEDTCHRYGVINFVKFQQENHIGIIVEKTSYVIDEKTFMVPEFGKIESSVFNSVYQTFNDPKNIRRTIWDVLANIKHLANYGGTMFDDMFFTNVLDLSAVQGHKVQNVRFYKHVGYDVNGQAKYERTKLDANKVTYNEFMTAFDWNNNMDALTILLKDGASSVTFFRRGYVEFGFYDYNHRLNDIMDLIEYGLAD
jgi:hypothetical protein